ncbi:acetate--CoA ligase family protein [Desulfobacula sp.]|uniref:acetate--CoA ligase family protein n=1 Tax=Desulfobacula sp. TaxID=2593537 RepID=UPI00260B6ABC|nr:acetate--CoA ligase family protein [Desulfobacula sp.]
MKHFFDPSAIAVFGVGTSSSNLAKNIIHNCLEMGFTGNILPVGKNPGVVFGKEIITNPEDLPEGIDLAVILAPAHIVGKYLDVCGRKGIRRAVVSTGGYREFKDINNSAEDTLIKTAKHHRIRFIGPNCIGIINTGSGLCTPFNPINTKNFKRGSVSIIAQSGGVANQVAHSFSDEHIGFSKVISIGNKLDLDEIDFIEYLMEDEDTKQIHLYLESIDNGRKLMHVAKKSTKPIIILKSNVSRTASEVAKSHTAALSNNDRIVDGALKQAGIIRVNTIHEMTVCAKALRLPELKGKRLVAISLSGGFSVMLGDACEKHGFTCPALPESLIQKIESFRRGGVIRMTNPMDFGDIHTIEALIFAIKECLALDNIDGMVLSIMYGPEIAKMFGKEMSTLDKLLDIFTRISKEANKPIGLSLFAERRYIEQLKAVNTFPVFNDPEESVLAIKMLWEYSRRKNFKQTGEKSDQSGIPFKKNEDITNMSPEKKSLKSDPITENFGMTLIEKAMMKGRTALSEYESKQFLASYQIPIAQEMQLTNEASLIKAAGKIGYPIVLKGCSPDIFHKTEKKLISVDIRNENEALMAFKNISSRMNGTDSSVLVQKMIKGKQELVVGLINDPHFGPCVMFGLGGIFTEILKDVSFRVAPLDPSDALDMINEIKGSKILGAARGMEAVDITILTDILLTIGKIGIENESIKEIDINPLIISGNKPVAVDALIVLRSPQE